MSSPIPEPRPTECSHCGKVDTAPKANIMRFDSSLNLIEAASKHFDCLSVAEEREQRTSAQPEGSGPKSSAIIDACKGGTKDDDLRELIGSGDLPVAEGLAYQNDGEDSDNG